MKPAPRWHALLALVFAAGIARAQRVESSLDASGISLRYADTVSSRAASFTPHVGIEWDSGLADATATYSEFGSSGRSIEGLVSGSRFIDTRTPVVGEIGVFAGGSAHSAGISTGELLGNARLHIPMSTAEAFTGVGFGTAWDGFTSRKLIVGEIGASLASGPFNGSVSVTPSMLGDSTRYADAQTNVSWTHAGIELSFVGGVRIGDQISELALGAAKKTWGSASASLPITSTFSLVLGGGTYPINPTEGFPGGRFMSVGVHVSNPWGGGRRPSKIVRPEQDAQVGAAVLDSSSGNPSAPAIIPQLAVTRRTPGLVTLTISAPGAERVEITGDFTNWEPVALTSAADGRWTGSFSLAHGEYQMNVRVNGGKWTVPRSLLSVADEFGGTVGLLIIE